LSLATPRERPFWAVAMEGGLTCARRLAREASARRPRGLRALSGREWSFGEEGCGKAEAEGEGEEEEEWARRAWVVFWALGSAGEGEREIMPEARLGFPMERRTVSIVFSIFRRERVRISCFLREGQTRTGEGERGIL